MVMMISMIGGLIWSFVWIYFGVVAFQFGSESNSESDYENSLTGLVALIYFVPVGVAYFFIGKKCLEPILRFLNLQLERQRCSRLESFF
jgi:membrane protein DedA with SNARE-associated domain